MEGPRGPASLVDTRFLSALPYCEAPGAYPPLESLLTLLPPDFTSTFFTESRRSLSERAQEIDRTAIYGCPPGSASAGGVPTASLPRRLPALADLHWLIGDNIPGYE